jgi:hypothetical protein
MIQALLCGIFGILVATGGGSRPDSIRALIERFTTDRRAIERFHDLPMSQGRQEVLGKLYRDWAKRLDEVGFDALDQDGRVDYVLLRSEIAFRARSLAEEARERERLLVLAPFAPDVLALEEARRRLEPVCGRDAAGRLGALTAAVKARKADLEKDLRAKDAGGDAAQSRPLPDAESAWRAADRVRDLRGVLETWHANQAAFDPDTAWWCKAPFDAAMAALDDYSGFLRQRVAKATGDEGDPLFGRPIGREAILSALAHDFIAYAPEDLIALADRHAAWCVGEMKKAAAEMGLGDDWKRALDKVKAESVAPGRQAELVSSLAKEAIAFCDEKQLVTIPGLCRDIWRLDMIQAAGQKHLPFASYGGLGINVAYPTIDMDHERKLMSMRGNNRHFSRLVVPHELIPGHHLQAFVAARERPWRREFSTPFHVEGWAVYGEMLFYRLGFPKGPEDRVGALFWRLHRCARIVVSLRYHLGEMTPEKMVDYLVDEVGLEKDGATAEVRRYVRGGYGPLYQCGYLVGALQIWKLREELGVGEKMTERAFHDALLAEGPIPVELARASLTKAPLGRDTVAGWRFGD